MSLYWRIFTWNAAVLVAATLLLILGPVSVSTPVLLTEALVLAAGLAVMLIANALLLRMAIAPIRRLTRSMTSVDLLRPGHREPVVAPAAIAQLMTAFNSMLDRLEAERATSAARALSAQESERARVAQELHDEVGQSLTAVLLELKSAADHADQPMRGRLHAAQELTRGSLDEIRRIARRLRPGVLDQLGLAQALRALADETAQHTRLAVSCRVDADVPELSADAELVAYRIAQESLTNAARHADAIAARVELRRCGESARLLVRDDGVGVEPGVEGAGIRGMRERALLVGADLAIGANPSGGTEVSLVLPAHARSVVGV